MKVIFMGTPNFAVPSLQAIINSSKYTIQAVFTQTPKPKNRGYIVSLSPIHELANKYNIPVYTPKTLSSDEAYNLISEIEADLIIVVAYGFIIPKAILEVKKYGCLNIHPSKLPRFRGAAPLQRTIISGDRDTAVCIMQMDEGLDTGDIILQKDFTIAEDITLSELHDKCANIGAKLLMEVLDNISFLPRHKQSREGISYAYKTSKDESKIDWSLSAYAIDCKIRGLNPGPGTYFEHRGEQIKVLKAKYKNIEHNHPVGYVIDANLTIACGEGVINLLELQRAGKQKMLTKEFLHGFTIGKGEILN